MKFNEVFQIVLESDGRVPQAITVSRSKGFIKDFSKMIQNNPNKSRRMKEDLEKLVKELEVNNLASCHKIRYCSDSAHQGYDAHLCGANSDHLIIIVKTFQTNTFTLVTCGTHSQLDKVLHN